METPLWTPDLTNPDKPLIAAFLDKFAIEDEIEEELDMPGWTEELVDELSDLYDQDVAMIERIDGVRMISA